MTAAIDKDATAARRANADAIPVLREQIDALDAAIVNSSPNGPACRAASRPPA